MPTGDAPDPSLRKSPLDRAAMLRRTSLWSALDDATLAELAAFAEERPLEGGERLIREGDRGESAYIVLSGRLEVSVGEGEGRRVVRPLPPGSTVGELSLLTDERRSADVYATRPSVVLELTRARFDAFAERHPGFLKATASQIARRLAGSTRDRPDEGPRVIALIPLSSGVALGAIRAKLREQLGGAAAVATLSEEERERIRGSEEPERQLQDWLDRAEERARWVLLEGAPEQPAWNRWLEQSCDRVLEVARAEAHPPRRAASAPGGPRRELLLLGEGPPRHGARWRAARDPALLHRVDPRSGADLERVARFLTGEAVGVAFAGGAFRGAAHVGVLRALDEAGIPIDLSCGTSVGSIVAALVAQRHPWREIHRMFREHLSLGLFDLKLSPTSFISGSRFDGLYRELFGETDIADLPCPFFSTSCNLSRAEVVLHRTGSVFDAVRTSSALAPLLPPVRQGDELLVDGVLLSNLPADAILEVARCRRVAINLVPVIDEMAFWRLPGEASSLRLLANRLLPSKSKQRAPTAVDLLMRAFLLPSAREAQRIASEVELFIEPDIGEFHFFNIADYEQMVERGYQAAVEALEANPKLLHPSDLHPSERGAIAEGRP